MSRSSCCCCHIVTAAIIVGSLQLLVIACIIADSSVVLGRKEAWEDMTKQKDPTKYNEFIQKYNITVTHKAYLDFHLANSLAMMLVWLIGLGLFACAFKYWKSMLAVPNILWTILAMFWTIGYIIVAAIGAEQANDRWQKKVQENSPDKSEEEATFVLLTSMAAVGGICWIIELIFLVILFKFYRFLRENEGMVCPGPETITYPAQPKWENNGNVA